MRHGRTVKKLACMGVLPIATAEALKRVSVWLESWWRNVDVPEIQAQDDSQTDPVYA